MVIAIKNRYNNDVSTRKYLENFLKLKYVKTKTKTMLKLK